MILCILYVIVPIIVIGALIGAGAALSATDRRRSGSAYAFFLVPLLVLLYLGILVYSVLIMLRFAVAYPACMKKNCLGRLSSAVRG